MAKAIALLSGGLDSTLAVILLRRQGIEVTAVTFLTHFGCEISDSSSCSADASHNARKFGFEVKLCHLADKFISIVKNPKYGHGRNMNPCIDCRILMLKEAKELMELTGADFIATGEVLGQRPMSQRRPTFPLMDREAGLKGYVLRPLSARLLEPTVPETRGIVRREELLGFNGRSRKPQIALAKEFGLIDYPAPAGGCLLTDPNFSYRLKELLVHTPEPALKDLHLLRLGRHFRGGSMTPDKGSMTPDPLKIIVGRDKEENARIENLAEKDDLLLWVEGFGSPLALISADANQEALRTAASLCARYSDAKHLDEVEVTASNGAVLRVSPASEEMLESLRIQKGKSRSSQPVKAR